MDGGQARGPNAPARPAKPPQGLSLAALDRRLKLRRRAREDAARNLPRQGANELSAAELAAIGAVAGERARIDQARNDAKAGAERRLRALLPTPQDFAGPALDARLALKETAARLASDWTRAAARAAQERAALDAFMHAHRLRRAARHPRSRLLSAAQLTATAALAAPACALLLAAAPIEAQGAAIPAIGLACANVALGALAGFFGLRYARHARLSLRAAGALVFIALAALALGLNIFVAARPENVMAITNLTETAIAVRASLDALLTFDSPRALLLLLVGGASWAFAAFTGYAGFDDPYPDYGRMDRAARAADEALLHFRDAARLALATPVDAARQALAARVEKMRAEVEAMSRAYEEAARKMDALDAKARALDQAAADAIALYRQENAALRTTPAPAYFAEPAPATGAAFDALGAAAAMVEDARGRLSEAMAQSAEALESLLADLEAESRALEAAGDEKAAN